MTHCQHGRPAGVPCPHCLGLDAGSFVEHLEADLARVTAERDHFRTEWRASEHRREEACRDRDRAMAEGDEARAKVAVLTAALPSVDELRVLEWIVNSIHAPRDFIHDERDERSARAWLTRLAEITKAEALGGGK